MTGRGPVALSIAVLALAAAAGAALVAGAHPAGRTEARSLAFQRLVHGLGFSAATDLSGGAARFDPRLSAPSGLADARLPAARGVGVLVGDPPLLP